MDPQSFLKVNHLISLKTSLERRKISRFFLNYFEELLALYTFNFINVGSYSCKVPAGLTALLYMCQSLTIYRSPPTHIHTYSHHVLKLLTLIIRHSESLLANIKAVLIVIHVIKELLKTQNPQKAALTIQHKHYSA